MENKIILEKGKYFLADLTEVKDLKPVMVIHGDDGEYDLWDFQKKDEVDYVYKDSQIGLFAVKDEGDSYFNVFEIKENVEVTLVFGRVVFGEEFMLWDRRGRLDLTSIEKC